jgi:phage-related protein
LGGVASFCALIRRRSDLPTTTCCRRRAAGDDASEVERPPPRRDRAAVRTREIHEVKADGARQTFRVLFATEGRHDQVLLSLEAFSKKTQKTPPAKIRLAKRRLHEWRARGR